MRATAWKIGGLWRTASRMACGGFFFNPNGQDTAKKSAETHGWRIQPMEKYRVGIVGATGMVGQRFISLLKDHPWFFLLN